MYVEIKCKLIKAGFIMVFWPITVQLEMLQNLPRNTVSWTLPLASASFCEMDPAIQIGKSKE